MDRRERREHATWKLLAAGITCAAMTGCGAAYYGAALGVVASQKKTKTTDVSFPDAIPTAVVAPTMATVVLSAAEDTIDRDLSLFNPGRLAGVGNTVLTDFVIDGIEFPPGYGEARSNRDADTTIVDGDRLVLRLNGDEARELLFGAADVAPTGTAVAMRIRDKVRALTPIDVEVPLQAYTLFDATYDAASGSYLFTSGAPSESSEVVFEPEPRLGSGDAESDDASAVTASRLGLGSRYGGIELTGADSIRFVVLNRGTDVIGAGTNVDLYLSHDKVLNTTEDLLFDRVALDQAIAVGEARRYSRRNGAAPPIDLLRQDLTPGLYYVLLNVVVADDPLLSNNLTSSPTPVLVALPFDDPAAPPVGVANVVDLVPVRTTSPISIVTGVPLSMNLTIANNGGPVLAPVPVDVDLVLSPDASFEEPGALADPTAALSAVLHVNSDDPTRVVTVTLDDTASALAVTVTGLSVVVEYDPATVTVAAAAAELQARAGSILDAFTTGNASVLLEDLATAAGTDTITTGDTFLRTRRVTFAVEDRPLRTQSFVVDGLVRAESFRTNLLPLKLTPIVRIRPIIAVGDPDNSQNNVRQAANYVRVYDRARAQVDSTTSATLPTVNQDDFATLDAVTQRPVNAGSIRQGQQRVLRFELPATGLTVEESQLLVILRTANFDAHIDLLNSQGVFITGGDDSGLGKDPVIYTSVQATPFLRQFYVVVSTARADEADLTGGGETFELTISINQRQTTDTALVAATRVSNVIQEIPRRLIDLATSPGTFNDVLAPLSLASGKGEVGLVLPQRARVRFATRPLFEVGVTTEITGFVGGLVPFPVEHQPVLDAATGRVVYRPTGGNIDTSHILEAGVYTFAVESLGGGDTQDLRLELETEFIPD
jgi:hypothetical protein